MRNRLISFILHTSCPICGRAIKKGKSLCQNCFDLLEGCKIQNYGTLCSICGKPLSSCSCQKGDSVEQIVFPFLYHGVGIALGQQIKEIVDSTAVEFVGKAMVQRWKENGITPVTGVTYMPTTFEKEHRRGFNPSLRLASYVARELSLPLYAPPFYRDPKGETQHTLTAKERRENVEKAYRATTNKVKGHLLLIDDVVTTGSTIQRGGQLLRLNGASSVSALCGFGTIRH